MLTVQQHKILSTRFSISEVDDRIGIVPCSDTSGQQIGELHVKVFGWAAGSSDGCTMYRMVLPLVTLAADLDVEVELSTQMSPAVIADPQAVDIVVGQRLMKPQCVGLWEQMAAEGRTMIAEHDDDLFHLPDDNPVWASSESNWPERSTWTKEWVPAMARAMNVASMVTCTNEHLAGELRQYNDHVVVLPNYIDGALLNVDQPVREPGQHLKVGWAGSATHGRDWVQAAPYVAHGMNKVAGSELVFIGHDYRDEVGYPRSSFRPWQHEFSAYFNSLTDLHIGLAPLADDHFNRSKSYVKALEYSALGIPVIANDVSPYRDFVQHGVTGFLVKYGHEWGKYIRLLAGDEDLRRKMGAAARDLAADHTIQAHAVDWRRAYEGILP